MKKIGLVGGIGPASTVEYYLGLIAKCHKNQGNDIYPEIVIDSVNMAKHDRALTECDYDSLCDYLVCSLSSLKAAGAEIAAITANTEHIVWDMVCDRFPLLEDKKKLIALAEKYIAEENADAMILGCTELPLAIKPGDVSVPTLNTTEIHINEIYRKATE